jgi:hypothetical protein
MTGTQLLQKMTERPITIVELRPEAVRRDDPVNTDPEGLPGRREPEDVPSSPATQDQPRSHVRGAALQAQALIQKLVASTSLS